MQEKSLESLGIQDRGLLLHSISVAQGFWTLTLDLPRCGHVWSKGSGFCGDNVVQGLKDNLQGFIRCHARLVVCDVDQCITLNPNP